MPREFDPSHVTLAVGALVWLHADIGGRRKATKEEAKKLARDMKHVEAVTRMFSPGYDVSRIAGEAVERIGEGTPKRWRLNSGENHPHV